MSRLRSLLFAPGNHARRVEKALSLPEIEQRLIAARDAVPSFVL